ncbi:MAG: tetratricopeptide repeat protein [Actinomycetota bacterium]
MQIQNNRGLRSCQALIWLSLSLLTGVGISPLAMVRPALAQLSQAPQPRSNSQSGEMSYELKGDELRVCRPKANASKPQEQECATVGKGYTIVLRTANDLYAQGNLTNAEKLFRQLISRYPKQPEAYYKLGTIFLEQSQAEDAIAQFRQAIQLNPEHAKAHNDLGAALASQGQLDAAVNEWRQAIQINGDYADALNNLGLALLQLGKKEQQDEAVTSLKKARELFIKQGRSQPASRIDQLLRDMDKQSSES